MQSDMTNKEDEENPSSVPCAAALLAVHLVGQVLDEAYVIANAAKDSGRPWRYVSSLKKLQSCRLNELYDEDITFTVSNGDSGYMNDNIENISNVVVTSTPQKDAADAHKVRNESALIGQGDEEFEVPNSELQRSTSMFLNHLFDVSNVEHEIVSDERDIVSANITMSDDNDLLIEAMTKIMHTYVDFALNIALGQEQAENLGSINNEISDATDISSYSYLSDASDISKDINESLNMADGIMHTKTMDKKFTESTDENSVKIENDVAFYENTYLTLNRDYEQYSEEEMPMLQDLKSTAMQEVELLTTTKSDENIATCQEEEFPASVISVSNAASRKSNLVRRCRIQGARLLSCLKGWWWKRKLPGRPRDLRGPNSIRGLCPLSPDARRRAASLTDHRNLRTPSPSKSRVWKFNTINETLVHSSRWKEFGVKTSFNENDEF